jgi:hypothetical protein
MTVTGSDAWAKIGALDDSATTVAIRRAESFISVIPLISFKKEWSRSAPRMQAP